MSTLTPTRPIQPFQAINIVTPTDDAWQWVAVLDDGTSIAECDVQGRAVRGLADVPLERVRVFLLQPRRDGLPHVTLALAQEQRLIFVRRRQHVLALDTGSSVGKVRTLHVLGWQQTIAGRNYKSVAYYLEDGSVLQSSDDQLTL